MRTVIILGLRRSGTTIFWETLRQDGRFVAYDEPLNPFLRELPAQNRKRTRDEFIRLFEADPEAFRSRFAPVPPAEELDPALSPPQADYLRWLLDGEKPRLVDFTRCNFKVEALHRVAPEAVLVHLHRSPAAFVTSHLTPSRSGAGTWPGRLADAWRRWSFWWRRGGFNHYHYEDILGGRGWDRLVGRASPEGLVLPSSAPRRAAARLLALSLASHRIVECQGPRCYGERFLSVSFEDWCADPRPVIERLYALAEGDSFQPDLSRVRPARGPGGTKEKWDSLARDLGYRTIGFMRTPETG